MTTRMSTVETTENPDHRPQDRAKPKRLTAVLAAGLVLLGGCATSAEDRQVLQPAVTLSDVVLTGDLAGGEGVFTLTATAQVTDRKGGTLDLLRGRVALTDYVSDRRWRLGTDAGSFVLTFDRAGEYPLEIRFRAAVESKEGWNRLDFALAPGPLYRVVLRNLPADTEFNFPGAARPERSGETFVSVLPLDGQVRLAWKEALLEGEGRLFFAAEAVGQLTVGQGLLRGSTLYDFKVMQGELSRVTFECEGEGEITRVMGDSVLGWAVEPAAAGSVRRLVVRLNQPQKERFQLAVQVQQPLSAFPLAVDPPRLRLVDATRVGGHLRIVNEGAVRLEVVQSEGLSQISPEHFPADGQFQTLGLTAGTQMFAYRFSGADYRLRLQADDILPELGVSQVMLYQLGETELTVEAELELDVREAPLRELVLTLPSGYALARLQASGMSDYFTAEATNNTVTLRIVYGQPIVGRQVVQLRLERNAPFGEAAWDLPPVKVQRAKSVRGHVGISADPGFRLSPATTEGLTELAPAFFPKKVAGLQIAFRLSDPIWQATVAVERLAQSIQADALQLFSVGEGIAYGSSVVNYLVSGAPVSTLRVELSDEYSNVEFTGREIRNWQKVPGGYQIQLHTPVAGTYTLLATYERPFNLQGETLGFTGARPLDAQSEQGHTILVSDYQFQLAPVNVSSNLLVLEPNEVPSEYRLFFTAPILAAYRSTTRPYDLQLRLEPLAQGDTLSQVVDRAQLTTRISAEGQIITEARYFVKSKGAPWFRVTVPSDMKLWSATVNNQPVVPVAENQATLIPLPGLDDPNSVQTIDLKLAGRVDNSNLLTVRPPAVAAPVLLAEWTLQPDPEYRLAYRKGSLTPLGGPGDVSGFAGLLRFLRGDAGMNPLEFGLAVTLLLLAAWTWRRTFTRVAHRGTPRYRLGLLAGSVCGAAALLLLAHLAHVTRGLAVGEPDGLRFLIPIQQAQAAPELTLANLALDRAWPTVLTEAWPALLGLGLWLVALVRWDGATRRLAVALAWSLLGWGGLRLANGLPILFLLIAAFGLIQVLLPGWRMLRQLPAPPAEPSASPAGAAALLVMALAATIGGTARAEDTNAVAPVYADSLVQDVRVVDDYARVAATLQWTAQAGQVLPLLAEPAVLTALQFPAEALERVEIRSQDRRATALRARRDGTVQITFRYEIRAGTQGAETGFLLPTHPALVQQVNLTLPDLEADLSAPTAVSIDRDPDTAPNTTAARLVLSPAPEAWIGWKPRSRDTRTEQSVFYAEVSQVYLPTAGVLEGVHQVLLRPAQGEIREIVCAIPAGFTIADVSAPALSTWRFDPDGRQLRVTFTPAQSRPLVMVVRSQLATGPLPYEAELGVLRVEHAAGQINLVAVATGAEVQLEDAHGEGYSPINLEDFPNTSVEPLRAQLPGLAIRRAFRLGEPGPALRIQAAAVEPDVRVESQQTLSLGEDRVVLAANLNVTITRAGIFRLSFTLPDGLDVETLSGEALSHWTMTKDETESRVITVHLKGKTEGQHPFTLTLSGPGLRQAQGWTLPRLSFREASKQQGQLIVVPEQGMRLQVTDRNSVTQLDPARSGIRQKGVLAFRLLQDPWVIRLDIEQVDAWIQVTGLQDVLISDGQVKVAVNLQYEIENTGAKTLRLRLPAGVEGVRITGDQVADYLPADTQDDPATQVWNLKLQRRILGSHLIQLTYQTPVAGQSDQVTLRGVQALDSNLQRGFLVVRAEGRLQLRIDTPPESLQPAEWQSIPRRLQTDSSLAAAAHTFRLVRPDFTLPVTLERREAVRLLPARVNSVTLTSVVSDDGVMLTQARLELTPGDKRLLQLRLPESARFWFAFVNQNGVWPWQDTNALLIPLEQQSGTDSTTVVEFLYTLPTLPARGRALDLELAGPKFDLPLENITWNLYLNDRWKLGEWEGTLQLRREQQLAGGTLDLQSYIQGETSLQKEQIREAEKLLTLANDYLQQGDPQQARRAFQAAYGLSRHDNAFNEDARVQLHNLKMQQALIGLNNRVAVVAGETDAPALQLRVGKGQEPNYTQEQAQQILGRNTAEENAVQMKLAERLVQQQEAARPSPAAIRAAVPERGRLVTFTRSLLVDPWSELNLRLEATAPATVSGRSRLLALAALWGLFAVLGWNVRRHPTGFWF